MNRHKTLLFGICLMMHSLAAQQPGEWRLHLATYDTKSVTETPNRVYALADGTLYSYGKDDNSVTIHSKQNGLSDSEISLIDYHPETNTLLVVYSNSNIDLISPDGLHNLPFLKNATNIPNKTVNRISFDSQNACLSTAFGIIVIRMDRKEVAETYKLNSDTYATCVRAATIYAATEDGLLQASVNDNLLDLHNWRPLPLPSTDFDDKKISRLCLFRDAICFLADGAGIFYIDPAGDTKTLIKHAGLTNMRLQADRLIAHTPTTLYLYESLTQYESAGLGALNDAASLRADGNYWIAAGASGLIGIKRTAPNQFEPFLSGLNLDGPKRNLAASLTMHDRKLLVAGGGRWTDRLRNPGTLMTCENGKWTNLDETDIDKKVGYPCLDYTAAAVDPNDPDHCFISTYGEGVLEIKNNQYLQLYNHNNTDNALQTIVPGDKNYIRVGSVTFDPQGNLWMTNCEVDRPIVVRTAAGQWKALQYPGVNNASYLVDKILITTKGHKWVNVPRSREQTGILVFDDRSTPADPADDISHFFPSFKTGTGAAIEAGVYYAIAEDLNGEIWIGTDKGPIYCPAPARAIDNPDNLYCNRIIRADEHGENFYFLGGEQINAIAVDGGNRKWLGTAGSGLLLVSPDGAQTIHHFTTDNSPLYSNTIQSIAIDPLSGEVFIGTDKGLLSYYGLATRADDTYTDVYAYPNPVRPDYDGQVIITGLMNNSNVKITDLNGHLIYQGKSAGGQFAWNCRTAAGRKVATGIYPVLISTPTAKESVVTKIAVIN
jgi:hypothetical protein